MNWLFPRKRFHYQNIDFNVITEKTLYYNNKCVWYSVEPSVRAELMEQVPHIAMYGQEYKLKLSHVVPQHLLPMVVKFLTDTNNQVRKTSQAALLVLLEQGLVERSDVQEQVCPVIIRLTEADSLDDYRTEAVAVSV